MRWAEVHATESTRACTVRGPSAAVRDNHPPAQMYTIAAVRRLTRISTKTFLLCTLGEVQSEFRDHDLGPATGSSVMVATRAAVTSPKVSLAGLRPVATLGLWLALACVWSEHASAQPSAADDEAADPAQVGSSGNALRGLVYTGLPLANRELTVRASAGYGLTERVTGAPSAQHRMQGGLAIGITPLPWLGFALRFDGRLEVHSDKDIGSHITGYGDPHLTARVGHALTEDLWGSVELGCWFPGEQAPSLVLAATSPEGRLQLAYHARPSRWTWLGSVGARWDNSAQAAPDITRVRPGDRVSLGLSSSSAFMAATGLAFQLDPKIQVFGELSADMFFGKQAPSWSESPLRAAVGGRYGLSRSLQLELTSVFALSGRPEIVSSALVPIEPRVLVLVGLSYVVPLSSATQQQQQRQLPPAAAIVRPPEPTAVVLSSTQATIVDDHGTPLPDVRVVLTAEDGRTFETMTDRDGQYHFTKLPVGTSQLEARAVGFRTLQWTIELTPGQSNAAPEYSLQPAANAGILRALVRSFDSEPLRATLTIKNRRGKLQTAETGPEGTLDVELVPGRYTITVDVPGYRRLTRVIAIENNGVSVLNADLRKKP